MEWTRSRSDEVLVSTIALDNCTGWRGRPKRVVATNIKEPTVLLQHVANQAQAFDAGVVPGLPNQVVLHPCDSLSCAVNRLPGDGQCGAVRRIRILPDNVCQPLPTAVRFLSLRSGSGVALQGLLAEAYTGQAVGRNNEKMGALVGEAAVAYFKKKGASNVKVIEIQGDPGGTVMAARRDGFDKVVEAAGIKIVRGPYAEYIRANAVTAMQDLLQANPDLNAVYAHNDDMAVGALQVLKENGRTDVVVFGVDGLSEAVKIMTDSDQYIATTLNDPRYLGDVTIQTARRIAAGEKVPSFVDAGTTVVTKENASKFPTTGLFAEYRPDVFK